MNSRPNWKERSIWLVVIAALSTSLMWLALVCMLALSHANPIPPQAVVLVRGVASAASVVVRQAWPALPLVALAGLMLAFAVRRPAPLRREVRRD